MNFRLFIVGVFAGAAQTISPFSFAESNTSLSFNCSLESTSALELLRAPNTDPNRKQEIGRCLVKYHLGREPVAKTVVALLQDRGADLLLREDILVSLAEQSWRRTVTVPGAPTPNLGQKDREALTKAVGSASALMDLTSSLKEMQEVVPVTRLEPEIVRAVSAILMDEGESILLRERAVEVLSTYVENTVASGLWKEKSVRTAQEALMTIKQREDIASWSTGAESFYAKLAEGRQPFFVSEQKRGLASQSSGTQEPSSTTKR